MNAKRYGVDREWFARGAELVFHDMPGEVESELRVRVEKSFARGEALYVHLRPVDGRGGFNVRIGPDSTLSVRVTKS